LVATTLLFIVTWRHFEELPVELEYVMVEEAAAFTVHPSILLELRMVESGDIEAVLWERTTTIATLP